MELRVVSLNKCTREYMMILHERLLNVNFLTASVLLQHFWIQVSQLFSIMRTPFAESELSGRSGVTCDSVSKFGFGF